MGWEIKLEIGSGMGRKKGPRTAPNGARSRGAKARLSPPAPSLMRPGCVLGPLPQCYRAPIGEPPLQVPPLMPADWLLVGTRRPADGAATGQYAPALPPRDTPLAIAQSCLWLGGRPHAGETV